MLEPTCLHSCPTVRPKCMNGKNAVGWKRFSVESFPFTHLKRKAQPKNVHKTTGDQLMGFYAFREVQY